MSVHRAASRAATRVRGVSSISPRPPPTQRSAATAARSSAAVAKGLISAAPKQPHDRSPAAALASDTPANKAKQPSAARRDFSRSIPESNQRPKAHSTKNHKRCGQRQRGAGYRWYRGELPRLHYAGSEQDNAESGANRAVGREPAWAGRQLTCFHRLDHVRHGGKSFRSPDRNNASYYRRLLQKLNGLFNGLFAAIARMRKKLTNNSNLLPSISED